MGGGLPPMAVGVLASLGEVVRMPDIFSEDYPTLNESDVLARRLVSLVVAFSNAATPLSSSFLRDEYYPDLSEESFQKQFRRDRERLVLCGLVVREADGGWAVDESSFSTDADLATDELLALDMTCLMLSSDPSFPYRADLRAALAKIDRAFADFPTVQISHGPAQDSRAQTLLHAGTARHAVAVSYRDAAGRRSDCMLAVLGEFGLRDHTYFVAAEMDEGSAGLQSPRVFRDDRFLRVRELADRSYELPADFDVRDWKLLPFQFGASSFVARFSVDEPLQDEARAAMEAYGNVTVEGSRKVWSVEARDLRDCARWAIAVGLVPLGPEGLRDEFRHLLKEEIEHAS